MTALTCLCKVIFSPFILLFQSIRIYFFGCLGTYGKRAVKHLCCGICVCCGCTFQDKRFPPDARSIGQWKGKSANSINREIVWKRLGDIFGLAGRSGAQLFSDQVEAADICQGQLGDCWLLSAAACLAKFDGAIQKCFLTREYHPYGRYRLRLFHRPSNKWVTVTIDDWIPCAAATGQPIFARPQGNEGWVLLLEKAFAKLRGSYAALDGGCTLEALEAMTGDHCFQCRWSPQERGWVKWDLVHLRAQGRVPPQVAMQLSRTRPLSTDEMFHTMRTYSRQRSVIAASTGAGRDNEQINGIVRGHAYAVSRVKEVDGIRLLQLRNPWGTFEWAGDWSDRSPLWRQYPKIAKTLRHEVAEDGAFWMSWVDFITYFRSIDICCRTTGWEDLVLDIHEECACIGPTWGCISGCTHFWCACAGCRALFFSRESSQDLRKKTGCCGV